jgi:hypothetical protein
LPLHPAIAESGFAALDAARSCSSAAEDFPPSGVMCLELLVRFAEVSDGRSDQGRVHPVAVVLALCAAAVVAGMGSFTAIAGWAADVPAELLAQLYGRVAQAPSKATIWRVVTGADATAVDAVIGAWLARQAATRDATAHGPEGDSSEGDSSEGDSSEGDSSEGDSSEGDSSEGDSPEFVAIAVDGKTVRGATDTEGNQVHLLAAATHRDALVLGQVEVGAKTNEIPMFAPLLEGLAEAGVDLTRAVITADALCRRRHNASYEDPVVMPTCVGTCRQPSGKRVTRSA